MNKRFTGIFVAVALSAVTSAASATLITFGDGSAIFANGYTESGMTISSSTTAFARIRDLQGSGERELIDNDGALYTFSLLSGGTFDLIGLDVEDPQGNIAASGSVDVIGSNSAVVNLLSNAFGTHSFGATFTGLTSFTMQYGASSQLTFDNLEFQITSVPETATFALMGFGLVGLYFTRRRQKMV